MKFEVDYLLDGRKYTKFFHGDSSGEAFASCLLRNPKCTLLKARKRSETVDRYSGEGQTEFDPPPIQRQPVETEEPRPMRTVPKYTLTPDPMPAMRDWAKKKGLI